MPKINFNLLMLGCLFIAIGFIMIKTWPEPNVFDTKVQLAELNESIDSTLELSCEVLFLAYMKLYDTLHDARQMSHEIAAFGLTHLKMGYKQYLFACSDSDKLPEPTLPLHLTI